MRKFISIFLVLSFVNLSAALAPEHEKKRREAYETKCKAKAKAAKFKLDIEIIKVSVSKSTKRDGFLGIFGSILHVKKSVKIKAKVLTATKDFKLGQNITIRFVNNISHAAGPVSYTTKIPKEGDKFTAFLDKDKNDDFYPPGDSFSFMKK